MVIWACEPYSRPNVPIPDNFDARFLEGGRIDRTTLVGERWVVNLWVPGCTPCVRELPALDSLRAEYEPQGIHFLALSLEPDEQSVRQALRALGVSIPAALTRSEVLGPLGVSEVPSTVFIQADGIIQAAASGERKVPFFHRRIRALLDTAISATTSVDKANPRPNKN